MIVQTKKRIVITLDEEDAENFLDDPSEVQQKVRGALYAPNGASTNTQHNGISQTPVPLRAPMARAAAEIPFKDLQTKPKQKRHASPKVKCEGCGEMVDPRVLWRHDRRHAQENQEQESQ